MEMLDHQKLVLSHVSEDKVVFRKELEKSWHWLNNVERIQLFKWVQLNFKELYSEIIKDQSLNLSLR